MSKMVEKQCGKCGIVFCLPEFFDNEKRQTGDTWYCPNGHARVYRESEADRYRREAERLKQERARLNDEIRHQRDAREHAERSASAYKGQVTRLKTRAKAGLCPCCNRHFTNLERHIEAKHPDMLDDDGNPPLEVIEGGKTA